MKTKNQTERFKQLIRSYEEKNETTREEVSLSINEQILQEETNRFKEVARIDEWIGQKQQFATNSSFVAGQGQTVNTFLPQAQNNADYNPNYTYLKPSEALKLAIERTLKSGAPINDISFYDEINLNLNKMGFNSKSALDIKNTILNSIKDNV